MSSNRCQLQGFGTLLHARMLPEVRVAQIFSGDVTKQTAVPNPRVWNFLILGLFCLGRMPSNVIPYYVPSSDPPQTNSNFWRMCCGSCRELAMLQVTWSRLQVTLTPGQPLSHCSCVWRPVPKGSLGQGTEAVRQSTILLHISVSRVSRIRTMLHHLAVNLEVSLGVGTNKMHDHGLRYRVAA